MVHRESERMEGGGGREENQAVADSGSAPQRHLTPFTVDAGETKFRCSTELRDRQSLRTAPARCLLTTPGV